MKNVRFETEKEEKYFLKNSFFRYCESEDLSDIKNFLNQHELSEFNLTDGLIIACKCGNLPVVKFFLETEELREKINLYTYYNAGTINYIPDAVLIHASFSRQIHVVDYLLYDVQFEVSRDTRNFLMSHDQETLNRIEKRDLFFKLNQENQNLTQHAKVSLRTKI